MIGCLNEVTIKQLRTKSTKYETRRTAVRSLLCRPLSCCNAEINPVHWFRGMSVLALSGTLCSGNTMGTGRTAEKEKENGNV